MKHLYMLAGLVFFLTFTGCPNQNPGETQIIYTVSFDSQGADSPAQPSSTEVSSDSPFLSALPDEPVKTGYVFMGWFTRPDGEGTVFTMDSIITANLTVYAHWSEILFSVTFDSGSADIEASPSVYSISALSPFVESLPSEPEREGFVFEGWFTEQGGEGTLFTAETEVTQDTVLYAAWSEIATYKVTFNAADADTPPYPLVKVSDYTTGMIDQFPAPPARDGYSFQGWYTGEEGTGELFSIDTVLSADITVYAHWEKLFYTITFQSSYANVPADPASMEIWILDGVITELPSEPLRTGYIFNGWYTGLNGSGTKIEIGSSISSSQTVYPLWSPVEYVVTFEDEGADPIVITVTYWENEIETLPSPPQKPDFFFRGWYSEPGGSGTRLLWNTEIEQDVTYYAYWEFSYSYLIENEEVTITEYSGWHSVIDIPDTLEGYPVTRIGDDAFRLCVASQITIPDTVTFIGAGAFSNCNSLESLILPSGLTNIGGPILTDTAVFTSLTIQSDVESDFSAFNSTDNAGNTTLYIEDNVTTVAPKILQGRAFGAFIVHPDNQSYYSDDGVLFSNDRTALVCYPAGREESSYAIPETTEIIEDRAMYSRNLLELTIPSSVTVLGDRAVYFPNLGMFES